ncbi:oxygen-independent coproporphyrinogen III oxidase [Trinickia acidisoli]|uniref:oxygen-independent coproporphyrinogen III oxidase n=1 Tax=Trinickia acidisoli TaxID=2767482 RepID=UPI001A8EB95F|nr:oxygen-independent coproporphyrinogen III oxidase [Trinickia acidisoli]
MSAHLAPRRETPPQVESSDVGRFADIDLSEALIRRFDNAGPRYTSYPSADRFVPEFDEAAYRGHLAERASGATQSPLSIYVHLPFCEQLCYFCACNKIITRDHSRAAQYLDYLLREMALVAPELGADRRTSHVQQLHLGGGTPTFFSIAELGRLNEALHRHFDFAADAELGVEIDPRTVTPDTLSQLGALGFNRTSFGVQDFDPAVQQAVNRIQPLDMVERALGASRDAGFESVNVDLIYGLPRQSVASFDRTLDEVVRLAPDRIALYNYAHLPSRFKAQRLIDARELPLAEERLRIFMRATRRLLDAGYVYIGLDHFAKPDDELSRALRDNSLHRNFQGYTTRAECDLIGFGVSAIGKIGRSYCQSTRSIKTYYECLDEGRLPVERGLTLSADDMLRREVVMTLMCSVPLDYRAIEARHEIEFARYFESELTALRPLVEAELIEVGDAAIRILPKGRLFVRAVAMTFDKYLARPSTATYSKLI